MSIVSHGKSSTDVFQFQAATFARAGGYRASAGRARTRGNAAAPDLAAAVSYEHDFIRHRTHPARLFVYLCISAVFHALIVVRVPATAYLVLPMVALDLACLTVGTGRLC